MIHARDGAAKFATRVGRGRWLAGGAAAVVYLSAVLLGWPYPIRLVYDGLVPLPPYRWVHPPAGRVGDNEPPQSGAGAVRLGPPSQAAEISTGDDQALVTLPQGVIATRPGESSVRVTIVPLDPAGVAGPPRGRRFDGNAYRIEARYAASGEPADLTGSPTVVLRYPVHARLVLRAEKSDWTPLPAQVFTGSQQVLANTDRLGVFVAAAQASGGIVRRGAWAGFGSAVAVLAGLIAAASPLRASRERGMTLLAGSGGPGGRSIRPLSGLSRGGL